MAGLLAFSAVNASESRWDRPLPGEVHHPGSKEAPASSPRTYEDRAGWAERSETILKGAASGGLGKWRRGYFESGDPGKYLPAHAMAKLWRDPDDPEPRQYLNDDRAFRQHYHFAAVNWARLYPLFGDTVLTGETQKKFADEAFQYGRYLNPAGTENHKVMWMTSANVLPHHTGQGLSHQDREATLQEAKRMLHRYVKGLFEAGQGEWDSSTYLMFDVNGMLNIYDFASDPEARLLAKAALDWYLAGYALKYRDGIYTAPNQRGFASTPHESIADQTGYLWWGSSAEVTPEETRDWRYTVHAVTSGYRPNRVLSRIATKELPGLPATFHNSKPNYWYGLGVEPTPNYHETVHVAEHYTMASLWDGHGGQMTRFQIVADSPAGGIAFTGGHPRKSDHEGNPAGLGYRDGIGRYEQSAQIGRTYLTLADLPDEEPAELLFLTVPESVPAPDQHGAWWILEAAKAWIALRPVDGEAAFQTQSPDEDQPDRMLRITGNPNGFVIETADQKEFAGQEDFVAALQRTKLRTTAADTPKIQYRNLDGQEIEMAYQTDADRAEVSVDGRTVDFNEWAVYNGQYIRQTPGVLTVNDGRQGYVIDFTGKLPQYKAWDPGRTGERYERD